jgi:hypothetical protein
MNGRDAEITALPRDLGSEIGFIMRRPNARTELHHEVRSARTKMFGHRSDGVRDDAELGAFFPRMHQADRIAHGVHEINGAAIRDVNSDANAALICDQAIAALKTFVLAGRPIDNTNALSVHLLRGNEPRAAESMFAKDFPMNAVQPSKRFHFVM